MQTCKVGVGIILFIAEQGYVFL